MKVAAVNHVGPRSASIAGMWVLTYIFILLGCVNASLIFDEAKLSGPMMAHLSECDRLCQNSLDRFISHKVMGELLSFLVVVKSDSLQNPIDGSKEYVECLKECLCNDHDEYVTLYTDVYYAHTNYDNNTCQLMSMLGSDYNFSEGPVPLLRDDDSEYNSTDDSE